MTYDSALDDAFHVYKNGKETIFGHTPNNLYAFTPPTTYTNAVARRKNMLPNNPPADPLRNDSMAQIDPDPDPDPWFGPLPAEQHMQFFMIDDDIYNNNYQFIETVDDNLKLFTKREQLDARLARIFYHACGRPDTNHLKAFIRGGYI